MALLDMCIKENRSVAAAHVNYHHRMESDEEEAYVREYCRQNNIPCYVKNEPFVYEGNFEAAARKYRYAFFKQIVKDYDYAGVLIAHQEDDLLETYIMQKEKNIVPEYYGLKEEMLYEGMLVRRPLLKYTKQELEQYCRERGVRYYVDCTNTSMEYARNKVRIQQVSEMSRFMRDALRKEIETENATLSERRCRVRTEIRDQKVSISMYRTMQEDDRLTLLRMVVEQEKSQRYSLANLKEIDHILLTKKDFVIPLKEGILVQEDGMLFVTEKKDDYAFVCQSVEKVMALGKQACFTVAAGEPGVNAVTVAERDFPLTIRNFKDEDKIQMRFGTKNVARFFVDRHIPLYRRPSWPVVVNAKNEIILVPGLGCDVMHYSKAPTFSVLQ